jgi:hypothetical protein
MTTDVDIRIQVEHALQITSANFDVDGIVREIIREHGLDTGTIYNGDFWAIVARHDRAATATYTETGELTVTDGTGLVHNLGYYDADGGEWEAPVDEKLRAAGYERTGAWEGDDAPVKAL